MKSKPVYDTLSLDPSARQHLFIAEGDGVNSVARAAAVAGGNASIRIFALAVPSRPLPAGWCASEAPACTVFDTGHALTAALVRELRLASMDTAVYVAGRERFLWDMHGLLLREGVASTRISMEPAGSFARKVYCVHCSAMNADVTDTIHVCGGCGAHLTVRDHFSRPLGAYMGVMVDAEAPGEIPPAQRAYA